MKCLRLLALASCVGAFLVTVACEEDNALVRPRLDAGTSDAEGGALACGAILPAQYESAAFATNAAVELAFASRFEELERAMLAPEPPATVSASELEASYNAGAPSLRAVSTTFTQTTLSGYFVTFESALDETWEPTGVESDGGGTTGGKFGEWYFSPEGVDLREATRTTLLGGALYNHALGLVASPITEVTIDRLLAVFGANPALSGRTDADAGDAPDRLIAAYASTLDAASPEAPGPYQRVRSSLLTMKAAVAAGEPCASELTAAVAAYLSEWERTTYGAAIHYLAAAADAAATADPARRPEALHAFGKALGLIQSFKGLPADKRKITDAQIDAVLEKIGAGAAYRLVIAVGDRVLRVNEAINDIALYEGFTAAEVEAFRKSS